jgi:hypothetical protein
MKPSTYHLYYVRIATAYYFYGNQKFVWYRLNLDLFTFYEMLILSDSIIEDYEILFVVTVFFLNFMLINYENNSGISYIIIYGRNMWVSMIV